MIAFQKAMGDTLAADSAVYALVGERITIAERPNGSNLPAVVIDHAAGGDTVDSPKEPQDITYNVVAISSVSLTEAANVAEAVRNALHLQHMTVIGWNIVQCEASSYIQYMENNDQKQFYYVGHAFRIRAHK